MDYSLIAAAVNSLRLAKDIGTAAVDLRDWHQVASEIAKINSELLNAQNVIAERERYTLFEIGRGKFVYRVKTVHRNNEAITEAAVNPIHYLCQPCFDLGRKMVLQLYLNAADGPVACCPQCKGFFNAENA